jgi:hypothetical protein
MNGHTQVFVRQCLLWWQIPIRPRAVCLPHWRRWRYRHRLVTDGFAPTPTLTAASVVADGPVARMLQADTGEACGPRGVPTLAASGTGLASASTRALALAALPVLQPSLVAG